MNGSLPSKNSIGKISGFAAAAASAAFLSAVFRPAASWPRPPLHVTLRLTQGIMTPTPPPKMTQGGNDPPNPPSSPFNSILERGRKVLALANSEQRNSGPGIDKMSRNMVRSVKGC